MKPSSRNGRPKKTDATARHSGRAHHNGRAHGNGRAAKTPAAQKSPSASYDQFKEFEGRRYTGMKIGRSHKWYYDQGEWKETKVTPDKWQIAYAVKKRRAGKAPEGSGVPVGTEYHWYILAHQNVKKLNANDYSTSMSGMKFKVAHKRADTEKWSATERAQRRRMIKFLQETIEELQRQDAAAEAPQKTVRQTREKPARKRRKPAPRQNQRKAVAA